MATRPGRRLGSALLSGESRRSFCSAGSDDGGSERRPELLQADAARHPLAMPPLSVSATRNLQRLS